MLRIECGCGKVLKVADDAVGKKVKCPACGELTLVKSPGSTNIAPAKPASASAASAVSAKPPPRRRRALDDEDDQPEKAPKKGGGCLIWGCLGGAAAAFFGLIVAGVAVWFFFLRGDGERPLTGPGSTLDPVAIKFFVPHKKGDRREVKVVMEQQTEVKNEG